MNNSKRPHEIIRELAIERESWSDAEVLAELQQLSPLSDEGDPAWDDDSYWRETAYRYVALSDVAATRKLRSAVPLLLERACNGDPGEIMRGLRHRVERTYSPDWDSLAELCMGLSRATRTGTRLWAMDQLMVLEDPRAKPTFEKALNDESDEVRRIAAAGSSG
jgi:hypothetical protein